MTEPQQPYPHTSENSYPAYGASQNVHYPPYVPPHGPELEQRKGMGIAALICGIASLVLASLPLIGLLAVPLAIAAVVCGALSVQRQQGKGMGIAGIITGVVGGFISLAVHIVLLLLVSSMEVDMEYYPNPQDEFIQHVHMTEEFSEHITI